MTSDTFLVLAIGFKKKFINASQEKVYWKGGLLFLLYILFIIFKFFTQPIRLCTWDLAFSANNTYKGKETLTC